MKVKKNYYWGGAELRTSIVGIFNFQVEILDSRDSSCSLIELAGSCSVTLRSWRANDACFSSAPFFPSRLML